MFLRFLKRLASFAFWKNSNEKQRFLFVCLILNVGLYKPVESVAYSVSSMHLIYVLLNPVLIRTYESHADIF